MEQKNPNQIIQESRQGKQDINIKLHPNQNQNRRSGYRRRRTFKKSLGRRGRGQPRQEGNFNRNRRANTQGASRRRNQNSRGGPLRKRRGPRLFIRNLTRSVTNNDLKTLFEKIGPLKRCGINWNDLGESKGTADVQYQYEEDTYKAFQKFDNTNIKGVPIRIELKGGNRNRKRVDNNNSIQNRGPRGFRRLKARRTGSQQNNNGNRNRNRPQRRNRNNNRNNNNRGQRRQRRYKTYNHY